MLMWEVNMLRLFLVVFDHTRKEIIMSCALCVINKHRHLHRNLEK